MNGQAIVDAVILEGGFDTSSTGVTRATVVGWCRERYADLVVRARWYMETRQLAVTAAGEPTYLIPDEVVEVDVVRIGSRRWERVGPAEMFDLEGSDLGLSSDRAGVFAPWWDSSGSEGIRLWPAPTAAGVVIEALCSLQPPEFQDASSWSPLIPADMHRRVVDGAVAEGMRVIEERQDAAAGYEARFEGAVEALRMRKNSRIGSGPQRLLVFRRPR